MAFANSSVSDIIATNIQSRSGELADNVTNNNALLRRINERGNRKTFSGGNVILQEIMYNDTSTNNTNSYSGYEVLNVSYPSTRARLEEHAAALDVAIRDYLAATGGPVPAFNFVVWAGKSAEDAVAAVIFETQGEA